MWSRSLTGWSEKWTFRLHVPQHSANESSVVLFPGLRGRGKRRAGSICSLVHLLRCLQKGPKAPCFLPPVTCRHPGAQPLHGAASHNYSLFLYNGLCYTARPPPPGRCSDHARLRPRPRFSPLSVPLRHSLARCRTGARAAPQTFTCWWKNLQTHGNGGTCNTWRCTCVRGIPTAVTLTS